MNQNKEVFLAADINYLPHLATTIASIVTYNSEILINLIVSENEKNEWGKVKNSDPLFNEVKIHYIDDNFSDDLIECGHLKKQTYYRLMIPYLTENSKVLYLDSDLVVTGSISPLFDIDLDDYYLAAVEDNTSVVDMAKNKLGLTKNQLYFNAGVILINVLKWKESEISKKVTKFITENPEKISFSDQCGLNKILADKWKRISISWNLSPADEYRYRKGVNKTRYTDDELKSACDNPKIIHFMGSVKPWNVKVENSEFKFLLNNQYWIYSKKTKYYNLSIIKRFIFYYKMNKFIYSFYKEYRKVRNIK